MKMDCKAYRYSARGEGNEAAQFRYEIRDRNGVCETQKRKSVEEIARKHKLEIKLVEQIVRLYVTHPGVTADGIMTKMGL